MIAESAKVFARVIPEQFRDPGFVVRGNLIFKKDADGNLLRGAVGQLEDGIELVLPVKSAARLSQVGNIASVVGAAASVINLGVCVAGFIHVSRSLKQVERRLENIDLSLERVEGMLGVIDQKIDQLTHLNELQLDALSDIGQLIKSYKTAEVHGALETLQFRLRHGTTSEAGHDVREAIQTLQEYRIWLSHRRLGSDIPLPVRAEILRGEVLVTLAEARARCFVKDEAYAVACLEQLLENMRDELWEAWNGVIKTHGARALFSNDDQEDEDWIDALIWLKEVSLKDAANELLKQMAMQDVLVNHKEMTQNIHVVADKFWEAKELLEKLGLHHATEDLHLAYDDLCEKWQYKHSNKMVTIQLEGARTMAIEEIFSALNRQHYEEILQKMRRDLPESLQDYRNTRGADPCGLVTWGNKMVSIFDCQHYNEDREEILQEMRDDWHECLQKFREVEHKQDNGLNVGYYMLASKIEEMEFIFSGEGEKDKNKEINGSGKGNIAADIASLSLCYRLARNIETALTVCVAMEAIGDPVRNLLLAKEEPSSPAIVLEIREPLEAD